MPRSPAQLNVPEEDHARRAPVFNRVWEYVRVHKGAPCLSGSNLPKFTPGMAQAKSSLSGIRTSSKEFELENCFQFAEAGVGGSLHSESRLSYSREPIVAL